MYTTQTKGPRTSAAAVVIAGHAALIYALAVTLGVVEAPPIVEPIRAVIIESPPVEPEPYVPPETPPVAQQPVVEVPLPEIPPMTTPVETITVPPITEVPPSAEPSTAPAVLEAKSLSVTRRVEPVYPPASRRLDEHGVVGLRILVDERGRPREVQVAKSSGYDRLDQAAVTAVRRWQFSPAMQESRAVTAWTRVNVMFQLNR